MGINKDSDKIPFLVIARYHMQIGNIPVPYRGRVLPVARSTFDPWTVTIINDTDFVIRDAMEEDGVIQLMI